MDDENVFDIDDENVFDVVKRSPPLVHDGNFFQFYDENVFKLDEESELMEQDEVEDETETQMDVDTSFYTELHTNTLKDEFEESKFDYEPTERSFKIDRPNVIRKRRYLIKRIEEVVSELVLSATKGEMPQLQFVNGKIQSWTSLSSTTVGTATTSSGFCSDSETPPDINGVSIKTVRFTGKKMRQRFALMTRVLAHAHENLVKNLERMDDEFYCTKRAFFYRLKNEDLKKFVHKLSQVEWAISEVCMLLDCGPWEIGFYSTNKGIVAGDLSLQINDSHVINYEQNAYHAVPDIVANVTGIRTTAEFVLVVEKDSVFQKLLHEQCPSFNQCILVTGKGYPDISTRMLVHLLSEKADLPVYAIVDANPFGFEIMCVYRFGTRHTLGYREKLLCPKMRWLGVHYKDLLTLGINRVKLTPSDLKKIESLRKRIYTNIDFSKHLADMKHGKAEIESINHKMERFLTKYFIPRKIAKKAYI